MDRKEKGDRAAARGRALGAMFADLCRDGEFCWTQAQYERQLERKRQRQADERKRHGLKPAPFVESGLDGDPAGRV